MDNARLIEIADELEVGAEGGWASTAFEKDGVELTASPKGFHRLAALMLRATASGDVMHFDGLADVFGDHPAIFVLVVGTDVPPDWKPPEPKAPLSLWLLLGLAVAVVAAVLVLAVIGVVSIIR